jgi:hypothetical protein
MTIPQFLKFPVETKVPPLLAGAHAAGPGAAHWGGLAGQHASGGRSRNPWW